MLIYGESTARDDRFGCGAFVCERLGLQTASTSACFSRSRFLLSTMLPTRLRLLDGGNDDDGDGEKGHL